MGVILHVIFVPFWFLYPVIHAIKQGVSYKKLSLVIILDLLTIKAFILTWIPAVLIADSKGIYYYTETRKNIVKVLMWVMHILTVISFLWLIYTLN